MQPQLKQLSVLGHGGFRRLAYAEWGPPRAARTVVCVHGVSRTGHDFDMLAAALAAAGARVVVPDLPGRGRSEWLESPAHYTDRAYTSAMSTLIARLDVDQVDWVGTSLGGHIGMLIASEYATPVRRLVLNDFGARVSAAALRRIGGYLARSWRFASIDEVEATSARCSRAVWQAQRRAMASSCSAQRSAGRRGRLPFPLRSRHRPEVRDTDLAGRGSVAHLGENRLPGAHFARRKLRLADTEQSGRHAETRPGV